MKKWYRYRDLVTMGLVNNRTTLHRWINAGLFPKGRLLGPNTRAWSEDELVAHETSLSARSSSEPGVIDHE
jgi:predicted DNA-binding transcriptional regulator AlpA